MLKNVLFMKAFGYLVLSSAVVCCARSDNENSSMEAVRSVTVEKISALSNEIIICRRLVERARVEQINNSQLRRRMAVDTAVRAALAVTEAWRGIQRSGVCLLHVLTFDQDELQIHSELDVMIRELNDMLNVEGALILKESHEGVL